MTLFIKNTRPELWKLLIGAVLVTQLLTGCANIKELMQGSSDTLNMVPVVSQPTGVRHPGKIIWHDLLTEDTAATTDFYGKLFGWTFRQQGRYTVVLHEGEAIAGIVQVKAKDKGKQAAHWLLSMSVSDVDQAASIVTSNGGEIHFGPTDMKNHGRTVLVSDPQGARLILLDSTSGDPIDEEELPSIGSWFWHELWTHEPEKSIAFYKQLAGYTIAEKRDDYWLLKTDEQWRAGVRNLLVDSWKMRWLPTIRVNDIKETQVRVEKLGGQVLIGEQATLNGSAAVIADPTGALLILQRWSDQTAAEEK